MTIRSRDVAGRLRALEDREGIHALIARYGPLADAGDGQAIAALFTPDGIYAISGFAEARGRSAIAALLATPNHQQLMADGCAHLLTPVAVTLAGNKATATGHSIVLRHGDGAFGVERVSANRWSLVRTRNAGWLVRRRDNILLDGAQAARTLLASGLSRASMVGHHNRDKSACSSLSGVSTGWSDSP